MCTWQNLWVNIFCTKNSFLKICEFGKIRNVWLVFFSKNIAKKIFTENKNANCIIVCRIFTETKFADVKNLFYICYIFRKVRDRLKSPGPDDQMTSPIWNLKFHYNLSCICVLRVIVVSSSQWFCKQWKK